MEKIIKAKFIKVPSVKEEDIEDITQEEMNKVFENMIGHVYGIYKSGFNGEYVIMGGITEESEKEYQESIYKSLINSGEDEDYAREVAKGEVGYEGCIYFEESCFEIIEEK